MIPEIVTGTNWAVTQIKENNFVKVSELKNPLVIAMWDYSLLI